MSWKKFGEGVLKGVKVASHFAPTIGMFGPIGLAVAGGLRIAAKIEGPQVKPYAELVKYIADQIKGGAAEDERLHVDATTKFIRDVSAITDEEPEKSDVEMAYWSALKHVKGEIGIDAIES